MEFPQSPDWNPVSSATFLGSPQAARRFIGDLLAVFQRQTEFAFYGSSLLLAYDAALASEATLRYPPPTNVLIPLHRVVFAWAYAGWLVRWQLLVGAMPCNASVLHRF